MQKVKLIDVLKILRKASPFWAAVFFFVLAWLIGVRNAAFLVSALVVHELGHGWAALRLGLGVRSFSFMPFVGAGLSPERPWKTREEEAYLALAGPAWGTAMTSAIAVLAFLVGSSGPSADNVLWHWVLLALALNLFNLAPLGILDGGRMVKSILHSVSRPLGWTFQLSGIPLGLALAVWINPILGAFVALISSLELWLDLKRWQKEQGRRTAVKRLGVVLGMPPSVSGADVAERIREMAEWPERKLDDWLSANRSYCLVAVRLNAKTDAKMRFRIVTEILCAHLASGERQRNWLLRLNLSDDDILFAPRWSDLPEFLAEDKELRPMGGRAAAAYVGLYLLTVSVLSSGMFFLAPLLGIL